MKTFFAIFFSCVLALFCLVLGWHLRGVYEDSVSAAAKRVIEKKIQEKKRDIQVSPFPPHVHPRGRR